MTYGRPTLIGWGAHQSRALSVRAGLQSQPCRVRFPGAVLCHVFQREEGGRMARITVKRPAEFSGHIGATRFERGVGETDQPTAVAYFRRHPDRFDVAEDEPAGDPDGGTKAPEPDEYDALTDEQVAEAYALNVGGNATSRKGQLRALRKLDAEADDNDQE